MESSARRGCYHKIIQQELRKITTNLRGCRLRDQKTNLKHLEYREGLFTSEIQIPTNSRISQNFEETC